MLFYLVICILIIRNPTTTFLRHQSMWLDIGGIVWKEWSGICIFIYMIRKRGKVNMTWFATSTLGNFGAFKSILSNNCKCTSKTRLYVVFSTLTDKRGHIELLYQSKYQLKLNIRFRFYVEENVSNTKR